jgi:hypothetical protein
VKVALPEIGAAGVATLVSGLMNGHAKPPRVLIAVALHAPMLRGHAATPGISVNLWEIRAVGRRREGVGA